MWTNVVKAGDVVYAAVMAQASDLNVEGKEESGKAAAAVGKKEAGLCRRQMCFC